MKPWQSLTGRIQALEGYWLDEKATGAHYIFLFMMEITRNFKKGSQGIASILFGRTTTSPADDANFPQCQRTHARTYSPSCSLSPSGPYLQ